MAASAPRFSKPPSIRQLPDDSARLFLECQVQGTPKPDITWYQNDTKLSITSTKHKQTTKLTTGSTTTYDVTLEITNLAQTDAGSYKIVAKNRAGEVTANVNLSLSNDDDDETTAGSTR